MPATQVAVAAAFIPVRNVKTFLPMVILAGAVLIKKVLSVTLTIKVDVVSPLLTGVLSVTENQILRAITAHLQAILFV